MYAQIGKTIFDGLFALDSFSSTDNTTYAEHALISGRPRLQAAANELQELTISIKLRAEFCNPTQVLQDLKTSKDTFEVLALVSGAGLYIGDYVISSINKTLTQTLPDGTIIEATAELQLKEFISDKLNQQQQSAKKDAFAVNKTPVNTGRSNQPTCHQAVTKHISTLKSNAAIISNTLPGYIESPFEATVTKDVTIFKNATRRIRATLQTLHDFPGSCIQQTNYKSVTATAFNDAAAFAVELSKPDQTQQSVKSGVVSTFNVLKKSLNVVYGELQKSSTNSITRKP